MLAARYGAIPETIPESATAKDCGRIADARPLTVSKKYAAARMDQHRPCFQRPGGQPYPRQPTLRPRLQPSGR
jgi:hypothetical protein